MSLVVDYVRERNEPYILFERESADTSLSWGQWKQHEQGQKKGQNKKDSEKQVEYTFGIQAPPEPEWKYHFDSNFI